MKATYGLVFLLATLLSAQRAAAQGSTIPEALAREGSSLERSVSAPSGNVPIERVLARTNIIVRGVVTQTRSYLSPDEQEVYTDYEIRNPSVLYRTDSIAVEKPGTVPSITVTLLGGTVELQGLQFKSIHHALPALATGKEHILLLEQSGGRYFIAGTYFGAFRVVDGHLEPSDSGFATEYKDRPVSEAVASLVAAAAQARQRHK